MKLRVWWIPQIPGKAFHTDVESVVEGVKLMDTLARYDLFQFEYKIKPDFCNAGGLEMLDLNDTHDTPEGSWISWHDEETGEDDPEQWVGELDKESQ